MLNKKDLYIHEEVFPFKNASGIQFGVSINRYEVKKYRNVKNLKEVDCYIVSCIQRITISNLLQSAPKNATAFYNYPALLTNNISITSGNDTIAGYYLVQYNPKTLNTNIMTDSSGSESSDVGYSQQHTSGSSTSQTNSYGGSASIGFMGDAPTGDISGNYEHSNTTSQDNSVSNGKTTSKDVQAANSNSMSIKDWGSYAVIDGNNQSPTWVWGQEYPWNVIQFKALDTNGDVILPSLIQSRLYDGNQLYPPTQLSLFGIDFVSKASWLVQMSNQATASNLIFSHTINYSTASHYLVGDTSSPTKYTLKATVSQPTPLPSKSSSLDLAQLALDSLTSGTGIGFTSSQFTVAPTTNGYFEIVSKPNDLLVRGVGFSETMSVDFSIGNVSLDVYFKITDNALYTLLLKCWKTADTNADCILTITINNNSPIVKNVNDSEFVGGDDNIISINLRNNDFTSADYYDYLQFGLNHISINITSDPNNSSASKGFQLRTIAIV